MSAWASYWTAITGGCSLFSAIAALLGNIRPGSGTWFPRSPVGRLTLGRTLLPNWLQVSVSTKLPEIDEREGNKFEPQMTTLFGLKAQQQALEFILPGKGAFHAEAQFVERDSEAAFASPFGLLAVPGILRDVGLQPGSEDTLALGFAVKARIQIEHGPGQIEPRFAGNAFAGVESLG